MKRFVLAGLFASLSFAAGAAHPALAATATTKPPTATTAKAAPTTAAPATAAPATKAPAATKTGTSGSSARAGAFCSKTQVGKKAKDASGATLTCKAAASGQPRWTK